jgi:hypothetical protein
MMDDPTRVRRPSSLLFFLTRLILRDSAAAEALRRDTGQSNSTVHQTGAAMSLHVLEKNGGDNGTRTDGLCRDSSQHESVSQCSGEQGSAKKD